MAEFSIQEASVTGFRVVREHPRALGAWAVYSVVLSLVSSLILVGLGGADAGRLLAFGAQAGRDPAVMIATFERLIPAYGVLLAVSLVSNAVMGAAMNRAVLRPGDDRFGFLRLGVDELRQLGLGCLALALFAAAYVALAFAVGLVAGLVGAVAKGGAVIVIALGVAATAAALAYLWVRLSLASPLTFDTGRIDLLGSWALTRGRAWRILGTYAVSLLLMALVYLLSALVIAALAALLNGGRPTDALAPSDLRSLGAYFTPFRIAGLVLSGFVTALVLPVWLTPPATVYRSLAPSSLAAAFG